MVLVDDALKIIYENTKRLNSVKVSLGKAYGMVLAEDILSDMNIPPFNKSAMDGYALRYKDISNIPFSLNVIGSVIAGGFSNKKIKDGECIKIMTGAPIPEGADSVIMIEDTEIDSENRIKIMKKVKKGQNICKEGEDIKNGEVVIKQDTKIGGPEIAILASVGRDLIKVYKKPTVGVISTGNEIVEPDKPVIKGKIRNCNGPMLVSLAEALGCRVKYFGIADDNEEKLSVLIRKGFRCDVLLISGGVSMGDYDLVPEALEKEGFSRLFYKVMVKPGKPLLFGRMGKTLVFGVPGNPVSNFTSFYIFIKPAVYKMMGRNDYKPDLIDAYMSMDFINESNRVHIIPSNYKIIDGRYWVYPFKLNGSADIIGSSGCRCFAVIDAGVKSVKKGEMVKLLLTDN